MFWLVLFYLSWLRFQHLALKPIHHDEAVNGWFTQQVLERGWYNYDPSNFHGPLLFHLFAFGEVLGGWGIVTLRAVTVAFSVLWLWYLWRFWRRHQWASKWFIVIVAMSPGFLFFSRSAIHEMPFLFFLTLFLGGMVDLLRYQQVRGWPVLIWGLAGMILLKETWVLWLASLFLSAGLTWCLRRPSMTRFAFFSQLRAMWSDRILVHIGLASTAIVLLYTGFFSKPGGMWDLVRAYVPWMKTGVLSHGHDKPMMYWIQMLWDYEKPLFFLFTAMLSSAVLFWRRLSWTGLWLTLAAVVNVVLYSLIPYKTPWCLLSVWGPFIFVFGLVRTEVGWLNVRNPLQGILIFSAFVALVFQWPENEKLNFQDPTMSGHAYVYVQTDPRLKELVDGLEAAAAKDPSLYLRPIQQGGTEAWPLAWALDRFQNQIQKPIQEGVLDQAILVVFDQQDEASIEGRIPPHLDRRTSFPIRDSRKPSVFLMPSALAFHAVAPSTQQKDHE